MQDQLIINEDPEGSFAPDRLEALSLCLEEPLELFQEKSISCIPQILDST